jgi:anti-sigma factor RsiW
MVRESELNMAINDCPSQQELNSYHDGERPSDRQAAIAAHLAVCAACREILSRWTSISRLFSETPHQRLSAIARARLYRRMDEVMDRGIIRLAWTLSGLAASVLLLGSVWLTRAENSVGQTASPPPWVAVAYASEMSQGQREPATPAAEYYLASSGGASDEAP